MFASFLALLPLALGAGAQGPIIPANDGWVTDQAHLLQPEEERALEALMESYRAGSKQEVALLTLPDLGGRTIEEVALETARAWKLGDAETNAGALLVVAQAERALRIEVGRGLEGTLTDAVSGRIIRDVIVPEFKAQRFYPGIRKGIEAIHAALGGNYAPVERGTRGPPRESFAPLIFLVIVVLVLARRIRRHGGFGGGFRGSSALPWILASQLGRGRSGGLGGLGGFGGFSGRSSGGGGGFSGFGGGGGFSGGGASGRW